MVRATREIDVTEKGLTLFLAGAVALVSLAFYLGLLAGRASARPGEPVAVAEPAPPPAVRPPATLTATPSREPARPARRPGIAPGFLGPPPLPSPAPAGGAPGASLRGMTGAFALEVAALTDLESARARQLQLLSHGYPAYLVPGPDARGNPVYRVRVGDYTSEAQAQLVRSDLREGEGVEAETVR